MKARTPKINWIIDAALLGGFLLAFFLNLTGVELHQWIGVIGAVLGGFHLLVHWGWVKGTVRRLLKGAARGVWLNALLDGLVFTGMLGILASGVVISTWLNLSLDNYLAWRSLHVIISLATLAAVLVKIGLHWRWIVGVARRFFERPAAQEGALPSAVAQIESSRYSRRDFLKLMGGVGLASLLAAANVLDKIDASASAETTSAASTTTGNAASPSRGRRRGHASASSSATSASGSDPACMILCGRNCSYPGGCRRYVDSNNNNRCDLSECMDA